jgi:hypothetical protein
MSDETTKKKYILTDKGRLALRMNSFIDDLLSGDEPYYSKAEVKAAFDEELAQWDDAEVNDER